MKYLKLVKSESELVDPKLDKSSVYYYKDGKMIRIFKCSSTPTYEMVDLGLSVMWATCNLGASSPEEYGNYYAWGETTGYDTSFTEKKFNWDDYELTNDEGSTMSKYNTTDGLNTLESSDDAVSVTNADYRMPTKDECNELLLLSHNIEKINNITCMRFTAENGNSIIIPFASNCDTGSNEEINLYMFLWSSTCDNERNAAFCIFAYNNSVDIDMYDRYIGCPVRPVCEAPTSETTIVE